MPLAGAGFTCDVCRVTYNVDPCLSYHCCDCQYDLCFPCAKKKGGSGLEEEGDESRIVK